MNVGPALPKHRTRYLLHIVKASEIVWDSRLRHNPSPFIELSLGGQPVYTTAAKSRTITPVWDERLKLKLRDPASMLSVNLRSTTAVPGSTTSIGSMKLRIQDLEELGVLTPDISLELFDMGKKTGVVVVRFTKVERTPVAKQSISAVVPQALKSHPDFVPPRHPSSDKKKQNAEYQSQDASMDQAERMVQQILARSSAGNLDAGNGTG